MKINLKYGKDEIFVDIPQQKLRAMVKPRTVDPPAEPETIIEDSLRKPSGKNRISEMVRSTGSDPSVTITLEDHTRPVPNKALAKVLMDKLSSSGVREENITFLIATGIHRDLNKGEMDALRETVGLGPELINHHADKENELSTIGELTYPDGTKKELSINNKLTSADIIILTGDVEFHQLFGYGGGAKSILPGTADEESVRFNHSLMDIPGSRSGNLDNPLRKAAERAADLVGVDFSINIVLNRNKVPVDCYAGDVHQAFEEAVKKVDELYKVPYREKADFVIVEAGGYPKDIDLYQAQKAVENGLELVKPGGELALVARCPDGWGSSTFRKWVNSVDDISQIRDKIKDRFVIGGHKAYIYAKEKNKADLYLFSDLKDTADLRKIFTPISRAELEEKAKSVDSVSLLKLGSSTVPIQLEKNESTSKNEE